MENLRSSFDIDIIGEQYILILDKANQDQTMSVTNDAENVVEYLYENYGLEDKRLFYADTDGMVDEMTHKNGVFDWFEPGYKTLEEFDADKQNIKK